MRMQSFPNTSQSLSRRIQLTPPTVASISNNRSEELKQMLQKHSQNCPKIHFHLSWNDSSAKNRIFSPLKEKKKQQENHQAVILQHCSNHKMLDLNSLTLWLKTQSVRLWSALHPHTKVHSLHSIRSLHSTISGCSSAKFHNKRRLTEGLCRRFSPSLERLSVVTARPAQGYKAVAPLLVGCSRWQNASGSSSRDASPTENTSPAQNTPDFFQNLTDQWGNGREIFARFTPFLPVT